MTTIYENKIKNIGSEVGAFEGDEIIILFGDNAPDTLKDYCHIIDVKPTQGTIEVGQNLILDGETFEITAVGNAAEKNLVDLGHMSIAFDGSIKAVLPGTIYVNGKNVPKLKIGSTIIIR